MRGDVLEAGDLCVLRRQVHDRVADEIRECEGTVDRRRREVPNRHADLLRAGLRTKPRDHLLGEVDAVDGHASQGQWKADLDNTEKKAA